MCSVQYGSQLEKVIFQFSTADFVYMLLFGMAALLVCLLFTSSYCIDQRQTCFCAGTSALAVRMVSALFPALKQLWRMHELSATYLGLHVRLYILSCTWHP